VTPERDWVEVVEAGPCPDCGFDATAVPTSALGSALRSEGDRWRSWLAASSAAPLRTRADEATWTALEYAAHVRDVFKVFITRVTRMLNEEDPDLGWWDHEASVIDEAYNAQDENDVVDALAAHAEELAGIAEGVRDDAWKRTGLRRNRERFTVAGKLRYGLHESRHHLNDADRVLTRVAPARGAPGGRVARVTLSGSLVRLEPLTRAHAQALTDAASGDRTTYGYTGVPAGFAETVEFIARALTAESTGEELAFATISQATGEVVGSTRFRRMEWWTWPPGHPMQRTATPDVCEIGHTWLSDAAQGTGINREAKLLMLIHAFDVWNVHRVSWRTDVRNERSRRAIEALGATYEGIRRAERPAVDGSIRDSVFFSMTAPEWPNVRRSLEASLSARR
jgi:N-acetyltransferase